MPELENNTPTGGSETAVDTPSNLPSSNLDPFDSIVAEVKASEGDSNESQDEPSIDDGDSDKGEDSADADATGDDSSGEPTATADDSEEDGEAGEAERDTAEGEEDAEEPSLAQQLLDLMRDPEMLERALRQAGVETVQELPIFKEVIGRERQSTADQTRSEIIKEAQQQALVGEVFERGNKAADNFAAKIDALAEAIESGSDELDLPSREAIEQSFNEFAQSRVQAYHNNNFLAISDYVYKLPEMQAINDEQAAYLEEANGTSPADWLDRHLAVARNNLWAMAQQAVVDKAQEVLDTERKVIESAHKTEIEKLTAKNEKTLKASIEKAREEARAEALADFSRKGAPPKLPNKDKGQVVTSDDEVDGSDFDSIARSVFSSAGKVSGGV